MRQAAALGALFLLAALPLLAEPPGKIPRGSVWIDSYPATIAELGRLLNRKAVPSPELAEWMAGNKLNIGFSWNAGELSYDRALDFFRSETGLSAKPGEKPDTVRIDFAWHRFDPVDNAPLADLVAALMRQPPPPNTPTQPFPSETMWERNFDTLLSAPENYSRAWKVRAIGESYGFFRFRLHVLYAGPFHDDQGGTHALVVLDHPVEVNPGAGRASYYLFDSRGRLERGCVFDTGNRVHSLSAWANPEKTELTIQGWFNYEAECVELYRLDAKESLLRPAIGGKMGGAWVSSREALYVAPPDTPTPSPAAASAAPSR